jgi:hypothetical protein
VRARALVLLAAAIALAASGCRLPEVVPAAGPILPSDDFGLELTDDRHFVANDMWVDTNAVRVDDALYFVFATSEHPANADPGRVFVRRLDLRTNALGPPVRVFDLHQPDGNNHELPSLARDAGALWVLHNWNDGRRTVTHLGCAEDPRRPPPPQSCGLALARRIPDLDDPRSWSADRGGLPMRLRNTFGYRHLESTPSAAGLRMIDWISVYDPLARTGYAVGQLFNSDGDDRPGAAGTFDGLPDRGGFSVGLVRFLPGGRVDGPYMITDTEDEFPGEPLGRCNVMTKPMLRLGRAVGARRRLHLFFVNRCQFFGKPPHSYWDPGYAFSDDGGRSWRNHAGTAVRSFPERIAWNDRDFRLYAGDVAPGTEGGFAVGDDDTVHYLFRRPVAGAAAARWRDPHDGREHVSYEADVQLELVYVRCLPGERCAQVGGAIERERSGRDQLAVATGGALFAFLEWPLRYRKSVDGGRSFGEAARIGPSVPTWRLHVNPDPEERDLLHLVMQSTAKGELSNRRLYYVRFDLGER